MDITTLISSYQDPAVILAFIVGLAVTVRFLSGRTKKVEDAVTKIKENHLTHIQEELYEQSNSLVRIETKLGHLPCVIGTKDCQSYKPDDNTPQEF